MKKTDFSTFDIEKGLEIERGRLREWVDRKFVAPSIPANGQGTRASFSLFDVYGVALFRTLVDEGLNREAAATWVRQFIAREKTEPDRQKTAYIVFRTSIRDGKKVAEVVTFARGEWTLNLKTGAWDLMRMAPHKYRSGSDENWRTLHVVNFKALCEEVDAAMARR